MATSYAKNKVHIYNWNAKNPDKCRELCKLRQRRHQAWKKISLIFRFILIDEPLF